MYLTALELMQRFGPQELAQIATPDDQVVVEAALMRATIEGTSRRGWTSDEIAVADLAAAAIDAALADAGALIDGYLASRYTLPLTTVPLPLKRIAGDATRYYLMDDKATEEVRDRFKALSKLLEHIRDGLFTLGAEDPTPAQAGSPAVSTARPDRVMTPSRMAAFTG